MQFLQQSVKFKCLNLLFVLALEPFLSQAACARVIEMGRDRPMLAGLR